MTNRDTDFDELLPDQSSDLPGAEMPDYDYSFDSVPPPAPDDVPTNPENPVPDEELGEFAATHRKKERAESVPGFTGTDKPLAAPVYMLEFLERLDQRDANAAMALDRVTDLVLQVHEENMTILQNLEIVRQEVRSNQTENQARHAVHERRLLAIEEWQASLEAPR